VEYKIVVGKVTIAKAIGIHILYIGIISFVINGKKGGYKEEK
jgi:hypothetical protein